MSNTTVHVGHWPRTWLAFWASSFLPLKCRAKCCSKLATISSGTLRSSAHPEIVWQRLQGLAACLLGRSHVVVALVPVGAQKAARVCLLICTHKSQLLLCVQGTL